MRGADDPFDAEGGSKRPGARWCRAVQLVQARRRRGRLLSRAPLRPPRAPRRRAAQTRGRGVQARKLTAGTANSKQASRPPRASPLWATMLHLPKQRAVSAHSLAALLHPLAVKNHVLLRPLWKECSWPDGRSTGCSSQRSAARSRPPPATGRAACAIIIQVQAAVAGCCPPPSDARRSLCCSAHLVGHRIQRVPLLHLQL